jgi:predicted glycogen debranching enzyme
VGDRVRIELATADGRGRPKGWKALLRTNLGRAEVLRREILQAHARGLPVAGSAWRDLPMDETESGWSLDLPLSEPGYFKAKAYFVDPRGWQHWPSGPDAGIAVHPDFCRTANTIYCAFTRLYGVTRFQLSSENPKLAPALTSLDREGFAVIPPSGTLRDLTAQIPHIVDQLGCRILQLLPVNPTPTTYARFGRFGSPYAALDLAAIDPALVVFDKRTTGVDQFRELTFSAHLRGARVFLDIVINHTGWGSRLQENHPDWFLREPNGAFASPGAWGNTWEDLVELKHDRVALWDNLAEVFLTWCRRGVDGFRCDAGYKVPLNAWQYIIARVQQEYPEAIFFLEGLGGSWEATEALLTEGGMQWAYSELFQNYSGTEVATYLDHSQQQAGRVGVLTHFSETHDNSRLAARGQAWSLLRNRLCALTSTHGAFGFAGGVEWLAAEKINVHGCAGLSWNNPVNLVSELSRLNQLLAEHPCFFDSARLTRLSPRDAQVYALLRETEDHLDRVLVVVNTDSAAAHSLRFEIPGQNSEVAQWVDLLGQPPPPVTLAKDQLEITLDPGAAYCLSRWPQPVGLHGDKYREARARAAWGVSALAQALPIEDIGPFDWPLLAQVVDQSPARFLAAVAWMVEHPQAGGLIEKLEAARATDPFPRVIEWEWPDSRRVTLVPPGFWLLIRDTVPFRAALTVRNGSPVQNRQSLLAGREHVVCFAPQPTAVEAELFLERHVAPFSPVRGCLRFLSPEPTWRQGLPKPTDIALLTNGRGAMSRMAVDLGRIQSKYDCVLGANLHPTIPVDRQILAKRFRAWINADGFISPLDFTALTDFHPGPPIRWEFVAAAGDGRSVEVSLQAEMIPGRNTVVFSFGRPTAARAIGKQLPANAKVSLTVRVDIEDRSFHWETQRNEGAEHHFNSNTRIWEGTPGSAPRWVGFSFTPATDRCLRVLANSGAYHSQPEWATGIAHPVEQSRGQTGAGDAFSPGWFEIPLAKGAQAELVLDAELEATPPSLRPPTPINAGELPAQTDAFTARLQSAIRAFVVRREDGKTVIAGYPWFLDWGRDTFIAARGMLAAGCHDQVRQILSVFARFEKDGTLPNSIHGADASNRDTTDAPLWFGVVCEELAALENDPTKLYQLNVDAAGRTLHDVLRSIATHYISGTPNGIRMDPISALVWSPSHFTWMDTNYPACTPREGYPIEIQALWIRLLLHLGRLAGPNESHPWAALATQASTSLEQYFWIEEKGWYADVLSCSANIPTNRAAVDDALRSNCLIPVAFGLCRTERSRRTVNAALRYLMVPGALRSLARLRVSLPLPNVAADGRLLNDPYNPYWGSYAGSEDTNRKPAYHNGTAWTWTFPAFCEAIAVAWNWTPEAVAAAKALLGSMSQVLDEGCLGQLPEIMDGDVPHTQRGCDAQAWSATEALRVWKRLAEQPGSETRPAL